jgi:hypothetical protein
LPGLRFEFSPSAPLSGEGEEKEKEGEWGALVTAHQGVPFVPVFFLLEEVGRLAAYSASAGLRLFSEEQAFYPGLQGLWMRRDHLELLQAQVGLTPALREVLAVAMQTNRGGPKEPHFRRALDWCCVSPEKSCSG